MDIVVVESPAKAKTINNYLGKDYTVLASYGHIRDLPAKQGSVKPDDDFDMVWEVDPKAEKHLNAIAKALKGAQHLYLATDPDREGEAISWHVREVLDLRDALKGVDVQRVVFHQITKEAVLEAMRHPREIDRELVDAYLARRALDYLVGFSLSPVLWRKLPGARSAGRVQSVALRLICEREAEIELFKAREYWTVDGAFHDAAVKPFIAHLTHLNGEKLDKFALGDERAATAAADQVASRAYAVDLVERKTTKRNPYPPFTTSTIQQEASRKLRFAANRTMRTAQRLYEGISLGGETTGLITYMRTDSVQIAGEAVAACREAIPDLYGTDYLPDNARVYKSTAKNAQEAHEAIRPTDVTRKPEDVAAFLEPDQLKLYELIWKRTMASQMASAQIDQVAVDIVSGDRNVVLRAAGSVIAFDGFLKLYQEDRDDPADENGENGRVLPPLAEGEALEIEKSLPEQHFTKPPPRFSEASLVKRLEELGIGRPSTYASILSVLQDRNYVRLDQRRFVPEDRGRLVTTFLSGFFERYVQPDFTADLENQLDDISGGRIDWKSVLRGFWDAFSIAVEDTKGLTMTAVIDALDEDLGPHFFAADKTGKDPRLCPVCGEGRLGLKLSRHGAFIGCSRYPECAYTRSLGFNGGSDEDAAANAATPRELGADSAAGDMVSLRKGPYGFYVQLGEATGTGKNKTKPKRAALPKDVSPATITLETALGLLALPREVGLHPETGEMITAGIGRYGPYLKLGSAYTSLGADEDLLTIGLNRAVTLIEERPARQGNQMLRSLGEHPDDGKAIGLYKGRYGPYVKHGRINAGLPKGTSDEEVTLGQAVELLAARAAKGGTRRRTPTKATPSRSTKKRAASKAPAG